MGYRNVVVSPVGTSLLGNFVGAARSGRCGYCLEVVERFEGLGIDGWARLGLDDERNRYPDGLLCGFVEGSDVVEALARFVEEWGARSCAEVSGIEAIRSMYSINPSETLVVLLPTKTCNSLLCSRAIERFLRARYVGVETVPLRYVGSEDDFDEFALEVLDKVVKRVKSERARGRRVFVNAAPGFKAEVSFLVLASILAGANAVVYIHEAFRVGVSLPIPPIAIDRNYLSRIAKAFSDRQCIDLGIAMQILSEEEIVEAIDRGILRKKHGEICIRNWIKYLLREVETGG
ncbi:MAG: putative CRISPR-associated protein [Crenarchaeota archaeon]|nr:putative CRISPR-associated protein [Thermoproteota archaeon]